MLSNNTLRSKFQRIASMPRRMESALEEIKVNQGRLLAELNRAKDTCQLQKFEFKVFSQWGEDGIIQRLIEVVKIQNKTFIEFGIEDFSESNCRFLMTKDNWSGFVIDGAYSNINRLKRNRYFWKYDIAAITAFVNIENINELLSKSGFDRDLGILSVDIDGNDYYVIEAIREFSPRILISEYNAVFGAERSISIPYDGLFVRRNAHHSNLYYGASLRAIAYLCGKKGYSLVGTNSAGNNAFFVRNDLINEKLEVLSAQDAFTDSKLREGRDKEGNLTYASGSARLDMIRGLPVYNVETEKIEEL